MILTNDFDDQVRFLGDIDGLTDSPRSKTVVEGIIGKQDSWEDECATVFP